ncbi:MAG: class I SAM-dependent rRNA methyltransferase [Myxococcales bacterium]|nr:class I SAM-dependent rRNA methyltransferase [Myxococcales bacterium]
MRLVVAERAARAARRGHPWVFRDALRPASRELPDSAGLPSGTVVELHDERGRFVARALYDADTPIGARLFTLAPDEPLDDALLVQRLARAFAHRDGLFADDLTDAYRLCHGEGDRLPGLVLDRYAELAVLRLDGGLWRPHTDRLRHLLVPLLRARGIEHLVLRAPGERQVLTHREPPDTLEVREHGVRFEVDVARGQKTGAFLDQRENRARVRALARGLGRVCNLFSYTGGFSLAAALGGAGEVVSVDVAGPAHEAARRAFALNDLDPGRHAFVTADAFAWLEAARARGERFDLVVCDPPSFAPSERAVPKALAAYRRLHAAALGVLAPGGTLCAASCSSHVRLEDFLGTLDDAVLPGRGLSVREVWGQPADHPTLAAWPEGRYLKFVVLA